MVRLQLTWQNLNWQKMSRNADFFFRNVKPTLLTHQNSNVMLLKMVVKAYLTGLRAQRRKINDVLLNHLIVCLNLNRKWSNTISQQSLQKTRCRLKISPNHVQLQLLEYHACLLAFQANLCIILQLFLSQLTEQQPIGTLTSQINKMKEKTKNCAITCVSKQFNEQLKQKIVSTIGLLKQFQKHLKCTITGYKRRYSSKIAIRAHVRKCLKQQLINKSE